MGAADYEKGRVYLPEEDEFSQLPEPLRQAMGRLELVMELDLYPGRKLSRANAEISRPIERTSYGMRGVEVKDPDGNVICFGHDEPETD